MRSLFGKRRDRLGKGKAIAPSTLITEPPHTIYANLKTFFPIMTGALPPKKPGFLRRLKAINQYFRKKPGFCVHDC
jgi:hypothetical protein